MVDIVKSSATEVFEYKDINVLLDNYADKGKSSLISAAARPDIQTYMQLEEMGLLYVYVAKKNDDIVGLIVTIDNVMPHYTEICTTVESLYVEPEYRKHGTAKRLVEYAEEEAKVRDSIVMFMSLPHGDMLNKVAKSFGFEASNTVYTKGLIDE